MKLHSNRLFPAIAAVLLLGLASGCSILPVDKGKLALVVSLKAIHDDVQAAATTAPASAEGPYNTLRKHFNEFIDRQQDLISGKGATMKPYSNLELPGSALADDAVIQADLAAFAVAAPATPTGPVLSSAVNATGLLNDKIYPDVDAIKDSRSTQASIFSQAIEKLKLQPWEAVNRPAPPTLPTR
jgi:hypothetical protein